MDLDSLPWWRKIKKKNMTEEQKEELRTMHLTQDKEKKKSRKKKNYAEVNNSIYTHAHT